MVMNKTLLFKTFINTTAASLYILVVSQIMRNGEKLFGKVDNGLMPFFILMLFTLSAAVVGGLVFGESIYLFFENKKAESLKAVFYSIGWLGVYTLLAFLVLVIIK